MTINITDQTTALDHKGDLPAISATYNQDITNLLFTLYTSLNPGLPYPKELYLLLDLTEQGFTLEQSFQLLDDSVGAGFPSPLWMGGETQPLQYNRCFLLMRLIWGCFV